MAVTPSGKVNRNPVPIGASTTAYVQASDINPIVDALTGATGGVLPPLALTVTGGTTARTLADHIATLPDTLITATGSSTPMSLAAWMAIVNQVNPSTMLTPGTLLAALSDPLLPLPIFVDTSTSTDFHGGTDSTTFVAGTPTETNGGVTVIDLEFTVSGAAAATSLTVSAGDQTKSPAVWMGVIQHDNGTYGLYSVTALTSPGTCNIYPALRATATNKILRNLMDGNGGMHFTPPGYRALARRIFNTTAQDGYRSRFVARWDPDLNGMDWTPIGLTAGQMWVSAANTFIGGADPVYATRYFLRTVNSLGMVAPAPSSGYGVSRTFALAGTSGMFEAFVSRALPGTGMGGSFRVEVIVDSVSILNQVYTGFQRVTVPYPAGTSALVRITYADESLNNQLHIGDVTFWSFDRSALWTASGLVGAQYGKTVVLGDSWTTYYNNQLGTELLAAMAAAGWSTATVTSVGVGGTDAEYWLAHFDAVVAPLAPQAVVVNLFTNDQVEYGSEGYGRWLTAMFSLGRKIQNLGARPIFVAPCIVGNQPQSTAHLKWSERLTNGLAR